MTFNANVPNASQSPGLFPAQNATNFTRLKTIINSDHVFNDTAQATDGKHRQVTLQARTDPVGAVAGGNGILYAKLDASSRAQVWFWNGTDRYQITPTFTEVIGSVNIVNASTYYNTIAIPADSIGYVYFYKGDFIQGGTIVSSSTNTYGYSYSQKLTSGSSPGVILRFGTPSEGGNALTLTVRNSEGSGSFNGTWSYSIFHRKKNP